MSLTHEPASEPRQVAAWFQTLPLAVRHRVEESDHAWLLAICPTAVESASGQKVSDAEREVQRAREAREAETRERTAHFVKVFPPPPLQGYLAHKKHTLPRS